MTYLWSVFTKPWAGLPGDELGRLVAGIGFGGAEIPVRDTAYVTSANAGAELPKFTAQLRAEGIEPISVASDLSEQVFAACAEAGVPMIRIMAELGPDGYAASVQRNRAILEQAVVLTERYDVQVLAEGIVKLGLGQQRADALGRRLRGGREDCRRPAQGQGEDKKTTQNSEPCAHGTLYLLLLA